jgi:hypothetical protein
MTDQCCTCRRVTAHQRVRLGARAGRRRTSRPAGSAPIDQVGEPRQRLLLGRGEGGSLHVGVYRGRLGGLEQPLG